MKIVTFTRKVYERLKERCPNCEFTVPAPVTIKTRHDDSSAWAVLDLSDLWESARTAPDKEDDLIEDFVARHGHAIREQERRAHPAVPLDAIQVVLATREYLDGLRGTAPHAEDSAPVTRPFRGDIQIACVAVRKGTLSFVVRADLLRLEMTEGELHALALTNTQAALGPMPEISPEDTPRLHILQPGNPLECARLIDHAGWAPITTALGGSLCAAAPTREAILFTGPITDEDVAALKVAADEIYRSGRHQISPAVLRWTAEGWEEYVAG